METLVRLSEERLLYELYQIYNPRCVAITKKNRCVAFLYITNDLVIEIHTRDTVHYFLTCFEVDVFLSGIEVCNFLRIL
jgi:hypothetical protein